MSVMARLNRMAYAVLLTRDGAIVGADVFSEPTPAIGPGELVTLFESIGDDSADALKIARARLLTARYNWIGPVCDHPGSNGEYRRGPVTPPRSALDHRPTTIVDLVADAVRSVMAERGLTFTTDDDDDSRAETFYRIGNRAHAWICDHGLGRAPMPDHGEDRDPADDLLRSARKLATAYEARMRSAKSDREAIAMFSRTFEEHKRAAVVYTAPLYTETAAAEYRTALDTIASRLGNATDGISSAQGYIDSCLQRIREPGNPNR